MKHRVLIVEDRPSDQQLAMATLEEEGYEVWTAATVEQALDIATTANVPFDAVVVDNRLAGEEQPGIAAMARGLTEHALTAGMVGWTSDMPRPVVDIKDRRFEFAGKGGEIDLDGLIAAVGRVIVEHELQ